MSNSAVPRLAIIAPKLIVLAIDFLLAVFPIAFASNVKPITTPVITATVADALSKSSLGILATTQRAAAIIPIEIAMFLTASVLILEAAALFIASLLSIRLIIAPLISSSGLKIRTNFVTALFILASIAMIPSNVPNTAIDPLLSFKKPKIVSKNPPIFSSISSNFSLDIPNMLATTSTNDLIAGPILEKVSFIFDTTSSKLKFLKKLTISSLIFTNLSAMLAFIALTSNPILRRSVLNLDPKFSTNFLILPIRSFTLKFLKKLIMSPCIFTNISRILIAFFSSSSLVGNRSVKYL